MSKQILPKELAEIIVGLLVKPDLLGELDSPEQHQAFMRDIAEVVATHCGGEVISIGWDSTEEYMSDAISTPLVSIAPDDRLPNINQCVWSYHDTEGWDEAGEGNNLAADHIEFVRGELQNLLIAKKQPSLDSHIIDYQMVDWRVSDGCVIEEPNDALPYNVKADIGNQTTIEFSDHNGEPRFDVFIEVNNGVPALHLGLNGGDVLLHVHALRDGIVLTPDHDKNRFEQAEINRYSYNDQKSLFIRE